jgi:periplasmic protein TonB
MTADAAKAQQNQNRRVFVLAKSDFERNAWWTSAFVRFFVIPTFVTVFLTSGVYWLHKLPSGAPALDDGAADVQVQLLPTLKPTPFVEPAGAPAHRVAHASAISHTNDEDLQDDKFSTPPAPNLTSDESFTGPDDGMLRPAKSSDDAAARFERALLSHLARFQDYPPLARDAKLQGTVQVVFVMRRDGTVSSAWISSSSGARILDEEAMAILHRAEPLPDVPGKLPAPLNIKWPVVFSLANSR